MQHHKSYSEATSMDHSSPPRSRPLYYVQSPSNHDVEKMSYGSSPAASPHHHFYHASPIHHSRESSTSRFSASLKNPNHRPNSSWKKMLSDQYSADEDDDYDDDPDSIWTRKLRMYFMLFLVFVLLFTVFSLILWGASKSYKPKIVVQDVMFTSYNVQAGTDQGGVPTDLMTMNSTVRISYKNPATFFGVHVTSTPLELKYFQLSLGSGQIKEFFQSRKSRRRVVVVVFGHQVPLYGGIPVLTAPNQNQRNKNVNSLANSVPMNLTFAMRSRAYILGKLVKSTFHRRVRCAVIVRSDNLGKSLALKNSCTYD